MAGKTLYKAAATTTFLLMVLTYNAIGPGYLWESSSPVIKSSLSGIEQHHIGRLLLASSDAECREVHSISGVKEKCDFVNRTDDCKNEDGFFQYNDFVYCKLGNAVPAAMIILVFWWVFTFIALAVCADDFFCPSLVVISKTLRLSPNVAGVTFLAFGNGAPDFFSAIASLGKGGDPGLGIGGMFGAGIFVTTVVVGAISVIKPFKASERPFLRDNIFYLATVYWVYFVLYRERIYLWEAIGLVCIYVIYVVFVIISSNIYKRQKENAESKVGGGVVLQRTSTLTKDTVVVAGTTNLAFENDAGKPETVDVNANDKQLSEKEANNDESNEFPKKLQRTNTMPGAKDLAGDVKIGDVIVNEIEKEKFEEEEEPAPLPSWWMQLLLGINPINIEEWPEMAWYAKGYEIFKSPILFVINLTCPAVIYDDELLNNWNKYLQCLQVFAAPVVCTFLIKAYSVSVAGGFKLWMLMLIIGFALSLLIFFTSKDNEIPKYHAAFGYIGFLVSLIWIYVIANEIVSLLECFGVVLNISNAILGLTLLAWGNSVGDLVSNLVMARQGFASMAFAACFGAPLFNTCLGFGVPLLINIVKKKANFAPLTMTPVTLILCMFLLGSMALSLAALPLLRFKVNRVFGAILLGVYIVFLIVVILTETKILLKGWRPT